MVQTYDDGRRVCRTCGESYDYPGHNSLGCEKRSFHIDRHHRIERRLVDIFDREPLPANPRIVDQNIDRPDRICRVPDRFLQGRNIRRIDSHGQCAAARRRHFRCNNIRCGLIPIQNDNLCAP